MKNLSLIFSLFIVLSCHSCTREDSVSPAASQKIKFELYSAQDLSGETGIIVFEAKVSLKNKIVLWDSVFAPIAIKDIPTLANKIVFEKQLPILIGDGTEIFAGFNYEIEGVGNSWYFENVTQSKKITFNFQ